MARDKTGPAGAAGDGAGRGTAWRAAETVALAAVPAVLAAAALLKGPWGAGALAVAVAALLVMAAGWEHGTPALRQWLPCVVLASLGAASRVAFAALPDIKPLSAVIVLAGATLGPRSGFLCGALAALLSNFFLGQGAWTPWQMYAWGLMGLGAGLLARRGLLNGRLGACAYGFAACLGYGWILDAYFAAGWLQGSGPLAVLGAFAASLPFDVAHGLATAAFLAALWGPWRRVLARTLARLGM